jgi:SpoVK/Ycf46/Vps4 family AAA+-type ATPase
VLDGVVDTPERIVVMTTNHPEILDPALIRPGRIDQRLLLGYMRWQNVVEMIKHYFQLGTEGLDESLVRRVREAILGNDAKGLPALNLTPAQVEQLSAEHDDVASMVAALEAKATGMIQVSARRPAEVSRQVSLSATQPVIIVDEVKEDDDEFVMGMPVPPKRQSSVTVTYE